MNATTSLQFIVTSSVITMNASLNTSTILTTDARLGDNTSSHNTFTEQKESGNDNGLIAVYVLIPILVLAGVLTVSIFILKRRKRRCCESKKTRYDNDTAVNNEAFSHEYQNEKNRSSIISTGPSSPSTYEDGNNKDCIYYENEQDYIKQSENIYYDYSNKKQPNINVIEGEFGYGQFKEKMGYYQNVIKQSGHNNLKEIKKRSSEKKSNTENVSEELYMNSSDILPSAKLEIDENLEAMKASCDNEDPLYDHAKAGGHEWDHRGKFRMESVTNDNENFYMNEANNNSQEEKIEYYNTTIEKSKMSGKIPVYLELEPTTDDDTVIDDQESAESKIYTNTTGDMYDYASSNDTDFTKDASRGIDAPTGKTNDSNSSSLHCNLEEEKTFQEEKNEHEEEDEDDDDSGGNHEYFILEKVERDGNGIN